MSSLVWIPIYGRTHFSMYLEGCVDAQSHMTVVSGLFSSTFLSFLEFRAPCLSQIHICSWVCTPVVINKWNGISQRGCIGLQRVVGFTDQVLLYCCFHQTRNGGLLMQSYGGVWKNQLEWKEAVSVYTMWRDIIWGSLKTEQSSVWLAQSPPVFLQPILCYTLWLNQTTFVRNFEV